MKYIFLTLLPLCCIGIGFGQPHAKFIDSLRIKYKIPELAYAVVSPDSISEMSAMGFHQNKTKIKAMDTDIFHLGSNCKAITGFIAARLVEQGKIAWDTRFFDVFPELKTSSNSDFYNITLSDLLSHRAKVPSYRRKSELTALLKFKGTATERRYAFTKYILAGKPVKLKTDYSYSNAGVAIGAAMLEKVSGKDWTTLVNDLATLLNIKIYFSWPNLVDVNQPWGHTPSGKPTPPSHPYKIDDVFTPSGDLSMSLPDYVKFIQINMQGIEGKSTFLKKETFGFLHYGLKVSSIGWGWEIDKQGNTISGHTGTAGTFLCQAFILKEKRRGIIMIANIYNQSTIQAFGKIYKGLVK